MRRFECQTPLCLDKQSRFSNNWMELYRHWDQKNANGLMGELDLMPMNGGRIVLFKSADDTVKEEERAEALYLLSRWRSKDQPVGFIFLQWMNDHTDAIAQDLDFQFTAIRQCGVIGSIL